MIEPAKTFRGVDCIGTEITPCFVRTTNYGARRYAWKSCKRPIETARALVLYHSGFKQSQWVISGDHFTCFCITTRREQHRWSPQPPHTHTHFGFVALYFSLFLFPPSPFFIVVVMFGLVARNFMAIYNCLKQAVENWSMSKRNLHPVVSNPCLSSHPLKSSLPHHNTTTLVGFPA